MKIVHFDTVGGIAGDMTLAAFISAGISVDELSSELRRLGLGSIELIATHVKRNSIDAVQVDVRIADEPHIHRDLDAILSLLQKSDLHDNVKEKAIAVFRVIAEAEARVHGTTVDKVHFHEVGATDSIADIVGTAICLHHFGIERVFSTPVRVGSGGLVPTQHGLMPTPAPATLEILKDYPIALTTIEDELTTPTGAAIIKALSSGVLDMEAISVSAVGYGTGTREFPNLPNLLRVLVGDLVSEADRDTIVVVETNIDDMNPQIYPFLIDQLLAAGAHDAYLVPITMKKGRPGVLLSVMADLSVRQNIIDLLYRETTTIGVRVQQIGRVKLPRRHLRVSTTFGPVQTKTVIRNGNEITTPEFEECRRISRERNLPLLEVMRRLERELSTQ
jgi:uncharacterized protein (TIGR00299 family) protein